MTRPESSIGRTAPDRRLRILVALPFTPRLDARHGGRASAALVARLAERHDLALLCLRAPDHEPVDDVLRERCAIVEELPVKGAAPWSRPTRLLWGLVQGRPIEVVDSHHPELTRRVRTIASDWQPEIVHLELERMAQYLGALPDDRAARVLVAVEAAGAKALDLYRASRGLQRVVRYLDLRAWRRFEPAALRALDALVCYTERDCRILAATVPGVAARTIPLGVEIPEEALDPRGSEPPSVVFVGGFGHPPNVDGAVRLAGSIFPKVRPRCPNAVLYLVGDKPPREVRQLARDGEVVVTGRVPAVEPFLHRASVVAAPLRLGGGMRVKVLEALAAGKAVVASPRAAEGIVVSAPDSPLVVAESDEEFADAVVSLLANPAARSALGRRARAWAEEQLDWEKTVSAYETLYADVLGRVASRG